MPRSRVPFRYRNTKKQGETIMAKVQDSYYFDTFSACAEDACRAAHLLEAMMQNFQPANIRQELDEIHKIEHSADEKKHELQSVLVKAFITPIEREDIRSEE